MGAPTHPISVALEAPWTASRLHPRDVTYNEAISFRKRGSLDHPALVGALNALVARYDMWHSVFGRADGSPVLIERTPPRFDLPLVDLSGLGPEAAERTAVRLVAEAARAPYDIEHGPLMRPRLMRMSADEHRLYLAMHHLIFDGVTLSRTVMPELVALYDAFAAGLPDPLGEPVAQYRDFAAWEREWITSRRASRRLDHWRERLTALPSPALPLDHPRPAVAAHRGGMVTVELDAGAVAALTDLAQRRGATVFQAFAAAWAALLHRFSGQSDVIFGSPVDLRQRSDFVSVVGYCLSPVVVRLDLSDDPAVEDLIVRARNELLDGLDHMLPFERVVRALGTEAQQSTNPIYQTMLVLEPATTRPDPEWTLHQLDRRLGNAIGAAKLDFELSLDETRDGAISCSLWYDGALFHRDTAQRLARAWGQVVTALADHPGRPISELALGTAEDAALLEEFAVAVPQGVTATVAERFAQVVARHPDAPAVTVDGQTATYGDLLAATERVGDPTPAGPLSLAAVVNRFAELGASPAAPAIALAAELELNQGDTVLVFEDALVDTGAGDLALALLSGAHLLVVDATAASDGQRFGALLRHGGVTFTHATPSRWAHLIATGLGSARSTRVLVGGEPLTADLADALTSRFRNVWNAFTLSRPGAYVTVGRISPQEIVTIGRPLAGHGARVLDARGRPQPVGFVGELIIDGPDGSVHAGRHARWLRDGRLALA